METGPEINDIIVKKALERMEKEFKEIETAFGKFMAEASQKGIMNDDILGAMFKETWSRVLAVRDSVLGNSMTETTQGEYYSTQEWRAHLIHTFIEETLDKLK